jgi:hypothetical protein
MQLDLSLVIVPSWLEAVMAANKLRKEALVDLVALSRIMSEHDICFYAAINVTLMEKIHTAVSQTFNRHYLTSDNGSLTITQDNGERPTPQQVRDLNEKIDKNLYGYQRSNLEVIYPTSNSLISVMAHNADTQSAEGSDDKIEELFLFELFEIREKILGIRFRRPATDTSYEQQLWSCYDKSLELLHLYASEHDIAKTPMFKEFVTLCRVVPLNM